VGGGQIDGVLGFGVWLPDGCNIRLEVYRAEARDAQDRKRDGGHVEETAYVGKSTLAEKDRLGT
jgi:hypothetical protein